MQVNENVNGIPISALPRPLLLSHISIFPEHYRVSSSRCYTCNTIGLISLGSSVCAPKAKGQLPSWDMAECKTYV